MTTPATRTVIATVGCPECGARVDAACQWFYGFDRDALHPARWERFELYKAEREKLKTWNEAAGA